VLCGDEGTVITHGRLLHVKESKLSTPPYPQGTLFCENDIKDSQSLAQKFQNNQDPVSQYIWGHFSASTRSLVGVTTSLKLILVDELNNLLLDPNLFDRSRFRQVVLADEWQRVIESNPQGEELARLNRYLLEQSYPDEIVERKEHLNLGVIFVNFFKWMLILLFALILQRAAEGITFRLENKIVYSNHVVHSPVLGLSDNLLDPLQIALMPHWSYLVGVLQMIITLLFAARYFLCLIDPLERISGIHSRQVEMSDSNAIKEALHKTKEWHILLVIVIALPEFLLLFHAATSFASYHQWICFLLLLVIWDSLLFFGILGNLHYVVTLRGWIHKKSFRCSYKRMNKKYGSKLAHTMRISKTKTVLKQLHQARRQNYDKYKERRNRYKGITRKLKQIKTDYGPWNYLDGLILLICLADRRLYIDKGMVPINSNPLWAEWIATVLICLLFLFLTWWFLRRFIIRNEMGSRIWFIVAVGSVLVCSIFIYIDSKMAWSAKASASEFLVMAVLFIGLIVCSFINYKTQPKLWRRHFAILRIKD
jgi:hypothetical protein